MSKFRDRNWQSPPPAQTRTDPEVKEPPRVVQPPPLASEPKPAAPKAEIKAAVEGLYEMDTAPKDGTIIRLHNQYLPGGIRAFWRKTRERKGMRWVPTECWADPMTRKPLGSDWDNWSAEV